LAREVTYIDLDDNFAERSSGIYGMTALQAIDLNANRLTSTISNVSEILVKSHGVTVGRQLLSGNIQRRHFHKLDKLRKSLGVLLLDCRFVIAPIHSLTDIFFSLATQLLRNSSQ
jgi:hypothetical protein